MMRCRYPLGFPKSSCPPFLAQSKVKPQTNEVKWDLLCYHIMRALWPFAS